MTARTTTEHAVLVFDGECNFCNGYVNFLIDRDRRNRLRFVRVQTAAGRELLQRHGISADPFEGSVLVIGDRAFTKTAGWLRTMRLLGGVWLLTMAAVIIPRRIRDAAFLTLGRHRYAWFGKTETCRLPSPARAHRFLDNGLIASLGHGTVGALLPTDEKGPR